MPYVIRCPHCQKSMQVPDSAAGKRVACPACKQAFVVPALQPAAVGAAAPAAPAPTTNGAGAAHAPAGPTKCPACGSTLNEGAVSCMDCGYMIQGDTGPAEAEGPPNLCTNPACG